MAGSNGSKPRVEYETSQVRCGRCKNPFEHYTLEVINDLVQLRCGDVILTRAEMVCMHCGCVYYWNVREKDMEKIATTFKELVGLLRPPYRPE